MDIRDSARTLAVGLVGLVLAVCGPVRAEVGRYVVQAGAGSHVVFESKAPLETFEGRTDDVSGWCRFDPDDLAAGVELEITVDLATFDTGNRKRNEHMRENHLETERFPVAVFRGGRLDGAAEAARPPALPVDRSITVRLQGELQLHGVARALDCEVVLRRDGDGSLRIAAAFPVKLSDHAIERPRFLVMKLADEQKVEVQLEMERQP